MILFVFVKGAYGQFFTYFCELFDIKTILRILKLSHRPFILLCLFVVIKIAFGAKVSAFQVYLGASQTLLFNLMVNTHGFSAAKQYRFWDVICLFELSQNLIKLSKSPWNIYYLCSFALFFKSISTCKGRSQHHQSFAGSCWTLKQRIMLVHNCLAHICYESFLDRIRFERKFNNYIFLTWNWHFYFEFIFPKRLNLRIRSLKQFFNTLKTSLVSQKQTFNLTCILEKIWSFHSRNYLFNIWN